MSDPPENTNVPSFLAQSPWYSKTESGHLVQLKPKTAFKAKITDWYSKGTKIPVDSARFRKGACTNCGSISHTAKSCCERPRKIAAKFSGKLVQFDELVENIALDYDAKHDRWNGFQPEMYKDVQNEYDRIEEAKKKRKIEELQETLYNGKQVDLSDEERNEEYAYSQMLNNVDPRTKTTTFNNRTREDTAGYLHNLDTGTDNYDGKSRSMKEVPIGFTDQEQLYRDSWVKVNGDMAKMVEQESFIQKLNDKGNDLNTLANPSQAELIYKWHKNEKVKLVQKKNKRLIEKYGDQTSFENSE